MKTTLLIAATALVATISGCGFAARSPDMYRDDTKAVLDTKNNDIRACYDNVLKGTPGVGGKVTVKFKVEDEAGKFTEVAVDKGNTTAPDAVSDCVVKSIGGLGITPTDARVGEATFVWEFAPPAPGTFSGPAPKS